MRPTSVQYLVSLTVAPWFSFSLQLTMHSFCIVFLLPSLCLHICNILMYIATTEWNCKTFVFPDSAFSLSNSPPPPFILYRTPALYWHIHCTRSPSYITTYPTYYKHVPQQQQDTRTHNQSLFPCPGEREAWHVLKQKGTWPGRGRA